ncbi:GNAT family N-acetyltransferase [Candidatus Atribacteria bacterium 1244-E10-H5-B2]|nr:MAG: GNAT family N-acetyltransferase [Candidatus Atribacteria bacterium 1244-E10-H5-B2]
MVLVRNIREDDAEKFLSMLIQLDNETKLMLYEPEERKRDIDKMRLMIKEAHPSSFIYVVEDDGKLVGFLSAKRGHVNRIKHRAYIVIGIMKSYTGKGIGKRLFNELDNWTVSNGVTRLELTVMKHNERAINLYKKIGYKVEGVREKSVVIDGDYIDEYYMAKIIKRMEGGL